jgi:hypothetical protein
MYLANAEFICRPQYQHSMRRPGQAEPHTDIRIAELGEFELQLELELIFELELLELQFELRLNCIQLPSDSISAISYQHCRHR